MPSGGRRPGQGRPKGSLNKRRMEIAAQAAQTGLTPLEVMIENMRFAHDKLPALLQEITRDRELPKTFDLMAELLKYRKLAQEAANDAAPYMHPRLANVAHSGPGGGPVQYEDVTIRLVKPDLRQDE